jgi:hypothetical protein
MSVAVAAKASATVVEVTISVFFNVPPPPKQRHILFIN